MATTSLWHIEGRLKDLIDYVENPEKTASKTPELQDLYNVFTYVQRPEATQEGEYVTAINCLKETALRQMILTKKRYGRRMAISLGTGIRASSRRRSRRSLPTRLESSWQRKCGATVLRSSSPLIWIKNICTAISALIPFLFGTAASTTIPRPSESE